MPLSNIANVLDNPKFKTPGGIKIRRYTSTTDDDGVAVLTHADLGPFDAVVVPIGPDGLDRIPEAERQKDAITVYAKVEITTGDASTGTTSDDIVYKSRLWKVVDQDDWLDWGFNVALCVLKSPGGRPDA